MLKGGTADQSRRQLRSEQSLISLNAPDQSRHPGIQTGRCDSRIPVKVVRRPIRIWGLFHQLPDKAGLGAMAIATSYACGRFCVHDCRLLLSEQRIEILMGLILGSLTAVGLW